MSAAEAEATEATEAAAFWWRRRRFSLVISEERRLCFCWIYGHGKTTERSELNLITANELYML